jgi:hypothetical protein
MHALAVAAIALTSGLHGMVVKGPMQPLCRQGQPCTGPAQVTLLFQRGPHTYRTRSTAAGVYRIALPPGYYTVTTAQRIGITPNLRPRRVHVRAAHNDLLNFRIDKGIR